jgi:hypothetical protein
MSHSFSDGERLAGGGFALVDAGLRFRLGRSCFDLVAAGAFLELTKDTFWNRSLFSESDRVICCRARSIPSRGCGA